MDPLDPQQLRARGRGRIIASIDRSPPLSPPTLPSNNEDVDEFIGTPILSTSSGLEQYPASEGSSTQSPTLGFESMHIKGIGRATIHYGVGGGVSGGVRGGVGDCCAIGGVVEADREISTVTVTKGNKHYFLHLIFTKKRLSYF